MSCPTTETLERLALGFLDDPAPTQTHLASCTPCKGRMETLVKGHAVLVQAAKAVPLPKVARPAPRRRGLWTMGAAAACVLGAIFMAILATSSTTERASLQRGTSGASPGYHGWNDLSTAAKPAPASPEVPSEARRRELEAQLREVESLQKEMAAESRSSGEEYRRKADERLVILKGEKGRLEREMREAEERTRYAAESLRPEVAKPKPTPLPSPPRPEPPKPLPPTTPPPPPAKPAEPARQEDPTVMIFKDPGLNPVVDTAKETQSTFAIDVDTASYTLMRSYLQRGALPPKESVRVEEYLNYFRYQDPHPPEGTFAVRIEAAPSVFNADRHLLRVAVQARETKKKNRKDFVLTLVIDVSGSMAQNNRLELVKETIQFLLEQLRPSDRMGIVVFSSSARKILDTVAVERKDEILHAIEPLRPEQSTNAEDGLRQGYDMAAKAFDLKATNRVILFSDGVANTGLTRAEDIHNRIREEAKKDLWLTTIGVGMGNYNDALLEKLANSGNGNYAYIDDLPEAKKVFGEKLLGTMEVVAIDAKVQVEFEPATVANFRLVGYENRHVANKDFRNDKIDAGEVGAGHHVTALYEVTLKPGGEGRLATARVRYREPGTEEMIETHDSLGRAQVLDAAAKASASYRLAAAVAQFAEVLRENPRVKDVTCKKILEQARPAVADLDRPEDAVEFLRLLEKAGALGK